MFVSFENIQKENNKQTNKPGLSFFFFFFFFFFSAGTKRQQMFSMRSQVQKNIQSF